MKPVAVIGATGVLGESLGAALGAAGRPYCAIARSSESLEAAFGGDALAERRTWNPADPASVKAALEGIETAVYAVGVDYTKFAEHPILMQAAIDGAIAAGVERMLLTSPVYSYGRPRTTPVTEDHPRNPHTFKGEMRKRQEDLLMAADAGGKLHGCILRLPDFYGPRVTKSYVSDVFRAAAQGGTAQLIGPVDQPHEYVFIPDVPPVILKMLDDPRFYGRSWNIGGPGTITPREFADRVFAIAGRKPRLFIAGPTLVRIVGIFNPLMREVGEMQYLFETPVILDDSALRDALGGLTKTPYGEGIKLTLASMQPH
jgi:nucleoside-diphosphate-sugar epimerase